jgi:hypothetical protein
MFCIVNKKESIFDGFPLLGVGSAKARLWPCNNERRKENEYNVSK